MEKKISIKLLTFLILVFVGCACTTDSDECRKEKNVSLNIAFKQKVLNQTTGRYTVGNLSIDSIWVRAIDRDSMIYNNKRSVQSIDLPLKKFAESTSFIIRFNTVTDTLYVLHNTNDNYFLSLECGCIAVHSINEVISTRNFIDSISVINNDVNTTKTTHIQIFN
jgi:hypothetical protein